MRGTLLVHLARFSLFGLVWSAFGPDQSVWCSAIGQPVQHWVAVNEAMLQRNQMCPNTPEPHGNKTGTAPQSVPWLASEFGVV